MINPRQPVTSRDLWFAEFSASFRREFQLVFLLHEGWEGDAEFVRWRAIAVHDRLGLRHEVAIPTFDAGTKPRAAAREAAHDLRQKVLRKSLGDAQPAAGPSIALLR